MKLKTEQLRKALAKLTPIYQAQMIMPILEHVWIECDGENIVLKASNLRETITMKLPSDSSNKPQIMLPEYKKLTEFVKLIAEPEITIEPGEGVVKITAGKSKATIVSEDAKTWPIEKEVNQENKIQVDSNVFVRMKDQCLPFACTDELRAAITGVNVVVKDKKIMAQATDNHQAAILKLDISEEKECAALIPASSLRAIASLFEDQPLAVIIDGERMMVVGESETISTRLIDERFPPLETVIPEVDEKNMYEVDKAEITQELRRANVLANAKTRIVAMNFVKDKIELLAEDVDYSQEYSGELKALGNSPIRIGVNAALFQKAISVFDQDAVDIYHCAHVGKAVMLVSEELTILTMPVMLN